MYPFITYISTRSVWTAQALQSTYGPKCTVGTGADTMSIVPTTKETWEAVLRLQQ
uniref:Uncharacterized protein n=1 Tax=Meloidogyne incognita TaxID=6306 RepID=A0A914NDZ7_MELIC